MLSTTLFQAYIKHESGQTINFGRKTLFQKSFFILTFNFTGVIKMFSFEFFLKVVKPLLILSAFMIQVLSCG
jgi:hypothetical protein